MRNTTYNGTRTDFLGFTKEEYTAIRDDATYEVRISTHPTLGTSYTIMGMNDYGETYHVHHGTALGKALIEQVIQAR